MITKFMVVLMPLGSVPDGAIEATTRTLTAPADLPNDALVALVKSQVLSGAEWVADQIGEKHLKALEVKDKQS